MSGDIYRVGISLVVTGNTTQFFSALSRQILGVHAHAHDLDRRLNSINRTLAVGGAVGLAGGVALLTGLKHVADHARELSHEMVQLKKLNVGDAGLAQVAKTARDVTDAIKGVKEVDALKAYGSTVSMFGHADSLKLMGPVSQFAQVAGNTSDNYEKASNSVYEMIRAGDLFGKFVDHVTHSVDIEKLKHFLDLGSKVTLGTHGKVDAKAWLALAQQGGPAMSGMTDKGLLTMAIAAQAMGGHRAGTALTSLYQQMIGGKMTESTFNALMKLDLAGGRMVTDKNGKQKLVREGVSGELKEALKLDPMDAVRIIQRQMVAHGITDIEKQVPILFDILGRQTTQRIVHDLLRNMPQIMGERERIAGSMGIDQAKKTQDEEDYVQAERNLRASFENLMTALAGPNASTAISVMNRMTDSLRYLTDAVRGVPPETLKQIGIGLGVLGVALIGGGAVAILAALGPAGWIAAGIVAATGAFIAFKEPFDNWLRSVTGMGAALDGLDAKFNEAAKAFGEFIAKILQTILSAITGNGAIINGGRPNGVLPNELPGLPVQPGSYNPGSPGSAVAVPTSLSMTAGERNDMGLILQHESGGRNVPNYRFDRGHTAQGYYQITNTNWRRLAPRLGITAPNAMSATLEEQTRVALALRRESGMGNWSRFNPSLRGALGRGDRAREPEARPTVTPPPQQRELRATLNVNLDGRRVASVVSRHQFDAANRPATAANFSDASEMYPQVG